MKLTATVNWLQNSKCLFSNEWLSLYQTAKGYVYSHETRCDGQIVLVLPYQRVGKDAWKFLVRLEQLPWQNRLVCGITGGCEGNPIEDAQRELLEEAGYDAPLESFINLGTTRASKSADTVYHLFAVDVAGLTPTKPQGDGNPGDLAPMEWRYRVDDDDVQDSQLMAAYLRGRRKNLFY